MTVQELIDLLEAVEDKSKEVIAGFGDDYSTTTIVLNEDDSGFVELT
jgi:hypothetical protein